VKERTEYDATLRLPAALRRWRRERGIETAKESYAALEAITGIPRRTFEHVEAGRGFRYPKLLLLVLQSA
jgi:hypothetical protein